MNRIVKMLMAGLMVLSLAGCKEKEIKEPDPEVVNPMTEVASLDDLNYTCGTRIVKPGVMGISDEKFIAITGGGLKVAEYDFTVAGRECSIRNASTVSEDISGYYVNGNPAFGEPKEGIEIVEGEDTFLARWFNIEGQFVFTMKKTEGVDEEYFTMIANEIATTNSFSNGVGTPVEYSTLCGNYQDSVSQRASMTVDTNDGSALMVDVVWGSSAEEATEWILTMKQGEDGLFYYNDCCKRILKGDEATVEYENGEGFFSLTEDGKFVWNGAADEECTECTFERVD